MGFIGYIADYVRINFINGSRSKRTPLDDINLNVLDYAAYKHDQAIKSLDDAILSVDMSKAEQSELLTCLSGVTYNTNTGVFTFTYKNGNVVTADLNIEKIPVDFSMSEDGVITMVTSDGTEFTANIGEMIKYYDFVDNSLVHWITEDITENKRIDFPDFTPSAGNASREFVIGGMKGSFGFTINGVSNFSAVLTVFYTDGTSDTSNTPRGNQWIEIEYAKQVDMIAVTPSSTITSLTHIQFNGEKVVGKSVSMELNDGSITADKLQPNFLADVTVQAQNAGASAQAAKESAESASASAQSAGQAAVSALESKQGAETAAGTATEKAGEAQTSAATASSAKDTAATKAGEAATSANIADTKAGEAAASATAAAGSASTAGEKAGEADTSATQAASSAKISESYARGGTGTRTGEDTDNAKYYKEHAAQQAQQAAANVSAQLVADTQAQAQAAQAAATSAQAYATGNTGSAKYYYEQARAISNSLSGALRPMGTVTFANLPALSSVADGDMYNVSDQFTTTSIFKEGSGNVIPAGSNVYKTSDGYWDVLAGSPVTGVKGSSETSYRRGNVNITKGNIGLGNVGNFKSVSTVANQGLSDTEKANARANIGAGTSTAPNDAQKNVQSDWNATSGDAFIKNKPTIPSAVTESTVSGWGFTKNAGTVTGIKMNGASKGNSGVVDLGTVLTQHQDISGKLGTTGDASNTTVAFTAASTRANIATGEKLSVMFGKIAKFFADLKAVAFSGNYSDLNGRLTLTNNLLATNAGTALDATQGKALKTSIDGINSNLTANSKEFIFAYDADTQSYGYKAGGADTFHPFSSGGIDLLWETSTPSTGSTITVNTGKDLSGYDGFIIGSLYDGRANQYPTYNRIRYTYIAKDYIDSFAENTVMISASRNESSYYNGGRRIKSVNYAAGTIVFGDGFLSYGSGTSSSPNTGVPVAIYGVKFDLPYKFG